MNMRDLYTIKKQCALWRVMLKTSGKVVYSSCIKANCKDWLEINYSSDESD